jgi:NAD+ diphosphatase
MRYEYCPKCGKKLIQKQAGDDGLVPYCEDCEKYWFDTFGSCVIIMVVRGGGKGNADSGQNPEVLLLRQKYMSDEYMNFVSGYITVGENAEESAYREVLEETGIKLDDLEYSGTWFFKLQELLMHGFIGYTSQSEFTLSPEVDGAQWVPLEKLEDYMYPDSPGNAQFGTYQVYLQRYGR